MNSEADSQPNVVSHYGQVYRSEKVCVSGHMFIGVFFLVLVCATTSRIIRHFDTLYILFEVLGEMV